MASNYSIPLVKIYNETTQTWVSLPTPSEYDGQSSTLVDSARNSEGVVVANVIRPDVASVSMDWNYLSVAQYSALAQLFEPKYGGAFMNKAIFWDSVKGDFNGDENDLSQCKTMYCGDRKVKVAHITLDSNGKPIGYTDVHLDLVEV